MNASDEAFLWEMLAEAAYEPAGHALREDPELARYVTGWGRDGDLGVLAETAGAPVGAAWLRLWGPRDRGYGYVDEDTPELTIGVRPGHRGQGVGTLLLGAILDDAVGVYDAVSLSVRPDNRAMRLYERFGFRPVPSSDTTDRSQGTSITMIRGSAA
ncbi:MAG: GNAT family N-acetyltransferase [Gemmatimonadales bacterium]